MTGVQTCALRSPPIFLAASSSMRSFFLKDDDRIQSVPTKCSQRPAHAVAAPTRVVPVGGTWGAAPAGGGGWSSGPSFSVKFVPFR